MKLMCNIIFFSVCFPIIVVSQSINYNNVFGNDYKNALQLIKENDSLFNKYANDYHMNAKALKAIIFPELIRYNSVYDAIEITSLKFLYIKKGNYYNDFSVGYFQMKPSFAEQIETDANTLLDHSFLKKIGFEKFKNLSQSKNEREERLTRITNLNDQLKYLVVFYKLCEKRFKNLKFESDIDKLKFYATAYNSGYNKSENVLTNHLQSKQFYTGKINKSNSYNYASISAYYYEN